MDDLAKAQQAAIRTADQFRSEGSQVRYMRSIFEPSTGHCQCLFEASDSTTVEQVNQAAALPYEAVIEVLDLSAGNS
jgi:hypothetical protein